MSLEEAGEPRNLIPALFPPKVGIEARPSTYLINAQICKVKANIPVLLRK